MDDLKELMQSHFLQYASYVILERALPCIDDGLKPVQRRILHTLYGMHDGKLHKVANIAGQTMVYHPHGDAPICDALVNLANKGFLLDQQGNFGNPHTGDPAAAARYIEARLSPMAVETLFNSTITRFVPSYDGRRQEPVALPAKIPLLLMQGTEGIAVGMATNVLPHNFCELLEAEIALLEGRSFTLLPDFPSGGLMDASSYDKGRGKVKLRARLEVRDSKTIAITQLCYGSTTESLIHSIDEAAKKGRIKLEGIHDYTAEKVEIELKFPRGQNAQDFLDSLYAYTECEMTLHPQMVVIRDGLPTEMDVDEMLTHYCSKLQSYLCRELEMERDRLKERIFEKSLERLFIQERLYIMLEGQPSEAAMHEVIEKALEPFCSQLSRRPLEADRDKLFSIPMRRLSLYDAHKADKEIQVAHDEWKAVEKELSNLVKYAINYLKGLLKKYGKFYPRRTASISFGTVDRKALERQIISVYYDAASGFVGSKVTVGQKIECTNFDKLLFLFEDGSYNVSQLQEKHYLHGAGKKPVYVGVADKQTVFSAVYRDPDGLLAYAKRFIISQYILDKSYRFIEEGMDLLHFTAEPNPVVELHFVPIPRQKVASVSYAIADIAVKGVSAKGIRLSTRAVERLTG